MYAVQNTAELQRILALPRRAAVPPAKLAEMLTAALKTTSGTMSLYPIQAFALAEAHDNGGLFGPIPVGGGKTLISLLVGQLMGAERPLLLTTPQLMAKFPKDVREMRAHWRFDERKLRALSYSRLSLQTSSELLERLAPDLLILDEAHSLSDTKSARTRRFLRYLKTHPETRLVVLSGTFMRRSLFDFWHLLKAALPHNCPLPLRWNEVQEWDRAIGSPKRPDLYPIKPGALMQFCAPGEDARDGYGRRLLETPGVVGSNPVALDIPLTFSKRPLDTPKEIADVLYSLRKDLVTPWGEELEDLSALWRIARQLAVGFYYRWVWPNNEPDHEWLNARRDWHRDLRDLLRRNTAGMDSPALAANAIIAGKIKCSSYWPWAEVRKRYNPTPPHEAVWINDFAIDDAADWIEEHKGIVWYEFDAFGRRLSQKYGLPFYGAGPKASAEILYERRPMVASISAHGTGKDLQHYSAGLLACAPPSGKSMEQLTARLHRPGQTAQEVRFDMYLHVKELQDGLDQARSEAANIEQIYKTPQKLTSAHFHV